MLFYIARRLVWTIIVLLVVLLITFAVFFLMPNGDPALRFAGKTPTEQNLQLIHERLHLDKTLMTKIVPWVPYLWANVTRIVSTNVTKYEFDQFGTTPSFAHIAVK